MCSVAVNLMQYLLPVAVYQKRAVYIPKSQIPNPKVTFAIFDRKELILILIQTS